jgi:hypothetical protein
MNHNRTTNVSIKPDNLQSYRQYNRAARGGCESRVETVQG